MFWGAMWLCICFHTSVWAAPGSHTGLAPLYRIDLRSVVKGAIMLEPHGSPEGRTGTPIRSLWFLDNQRLAVTLVTHAGGKPELAKRNEPNASSAFRLNASIIEASSGKVLSTPEWPSNSRYAGIVAANDKGLITERGEELTLLSPDLVPIKRLTLPPLPANQLTGYWSPHPSWSGRRVLFFAGPAWTRIRWLWLDAENLQVLESWEDVITGPVAVSDRRLAMSTGGRHFGDPPPTLVLSEPGGDWRRVPSTTHVSSLQFVGSDLLYLQFYPGIGHSGRSGVFLMRTDGGEVSHLEPPHKGWGFDRAATSLNGKRFVIPAVESKGGHPALDISGHLVLRGLLVFDQPFSGPSLTIGVQDSQVRNPDTVALSPDGRHLAVLAYPDPVLEVYELPPPN